MQKVCLWQPDLGRIPGGARACILLHQVRLSPLRASLVLRIESRCDSGADEVHQGTGQSGAIQICPIVMSCHARSCFAISSQLRHLPALNFLSAQVAGDPQGLRRCAVRQQKCRSWRYTAQHGRLIVRVSGAGFSARAVTKPYNYMSEARQTIRRRLATMKGTEICSLRRQWYLTTMDRQPLCLAHLHLQHRDD